MPQLVNPSTGTLHDVADADVAGALASGWHPQTVGEADIASTTTANELNFGGVAGGIKAGLAGLARGATLGGSDVAAQVFGGADTARVLSGLQAQNPITSGVTEVVGAIAPALITGGAATPAGLVGRVGRGVTSGLTREGAGLAERVAAHTVGAAAEGSLYGGGQYLSQVALEDKPISAEGFIGGMGKGALFAAPVGGGFALAGEALLRARSLFPRSQVTPEAAAVIKNEASTALRDSVTDADAMAQTARQKIAQADAQAGAAGARTQVTRAVFGGGEPDAIGAAADATANKAQLVDALQKLETSQTALKDWIAAGGDDELADIALAARRPVTPEVPVGEFAAPGARGYKPGEIAAPGPPSQAPLAVEPQGTPVTRAMRKGAPSALDDIGTAPTGVAPPEQDLLAALQGTQEQLGAGKSMREVAGLPRLAETAAPARELASEKEFRDFQSSLRLRLDDDEIEQAVRYSREYYNDVNRHLRGDPRNAVLPESEAKIIPALDSMLEKSRVAEPVITHRGASVRRVGNLQPGDVYVDPGYGSTSWRSNNVKTFGDVHMIIESPAGTRIAPIPSSKAEGEFLLPRDTKYRITGRRELPDGRIELRATVEDATAGSGHGPLRLGPPTIDKPLEAMSRRELEYSLDRAGEHQHSFQSAAERKSPEFKAAQDRYNEISERLRAVKAGAKIETAPADDLLSQLQGTAAKIGEGQSIADIGAASPARAEYVASKLSKRAEDAAYFRARAQGAATSDGGDLLAQLQGTSEGLGSGKSMREIGGAPMVSDRVGASGPASLADIQPAKAPSDMTRLRAVAADIGAMPVSAAEYSARREAMGLASATAKKNIGRAADNDAIERLLQKHSGKNVDIGPALSTAAKVIGEHEADSARMADLLGADAPKTAVQRAEALQAARKAHAEAQGASSAQTAQRIGDRGLSGIADQTVVDSDITQALRRHESTVEGAKDRAVTSMARAETKAAPAAAPAKTGLGGKLADVGTALEVMKALGVHVPALSAIPVIGPVLGLFFKARAVLGILGRKGGSVGRDVDGLIAAGAAATRDRLAKATDAILTGAGKGSLELSEALDGPSVTLSYKLFPGDGITKSKDPQKLYEARMDEIARAQQPNAIDHAIADRYQTSDPNLHDALVAQVQRGTAFLDSKAPKPSILQTMLPGDGPWKPSKAQLDEWGKYVHAVGDPVSVLEDLAKGHVTLEGAETLRVVYPELFAEGRRLLMQAAPQMQKTLPYPTRVAISILYRIPVDGSMAPGHLQYLQAGSQAPAAAGAGPAGAPQMPPAITGPLKLGQQTMTSLDRRAGA